MSRSYNRALRPVARLAHTNPLIFWCLASGFFLAAAALVLILTTGRATTPVAPAPPPLPANCVMFC